MTHALRKVIILASILFLLWLLYSMWHSTPRATGPSVTPTTTSVSYTDEMQLTTPTANQSVTSPLRITGRARGSWFFEASFPVRLETVSGEVLNATHVQAQADWMTNEFVPFEGVLPFAVSSTQSAVLILNADNPSGLPEHTKTIRVPVILMPQ